MLLEISSANNICSGLDELKWFYWHQPGDQAPPKLSKSPAGSGNCDWRSTWDVVLTASARRFASCSTISGWRDARFIRSLGSTEKRVQYISQMPPKHKTFSTKWRLILSSVLSLPTTKHCSVLRYLQAQCWPIPESRYWRSLWPYDVSIWWKITYLSTHYTFNP